MKARVGRRGHGLYAAVLALSAGCADAPVPEPAVDVATDTAVLDGTQRRQRAFLALDGEGLRVVLSETGATRLLSFGMPRQEAEAAIANVLEVDPEETGESVDCAMHHVRWPDGIVTWFTNDRFTGWSIDDRSALTTLAGVGVGSTRGQLLDVHAADVQTTSLGEEFTAGGIAGLLDSTPPAGRITHMWSGTVCIAR